MEQNPQHGKQRIMIDTELFKPFIFKKRSSPFEMKHKSDSFAI